MIIVEALAGNALAAIGAASVDVEPSREIEVTVPVTPGNTGDPCRLDAECRGTSAICITSRFGATWPGGYCSATCSPARNNVATGVNPDCPGRGWCDFEGRCLTPCTAKSCKRASYACFTEGCSPTALSRCNPATRGSCGAGKTCIRTGVDDVGDCYPACDPFRQSCPSVGGKGAGCYVSFDTGEGGCIVYNVGGEGKRCGFLNDCSPGLMCHQNACRPYCGGPSNRGCSNGHSCIPFSNRVPVSVAGVCAG